MLTRRWQKAIVGGLTVIVLTLMLAKAAVCAPTPQPTIRLMFASWEGPEGANMIPAQAWAKELEKRSGGRVKVEFAYGEAMGKAPEHYDLAARGVADIAYSSLQFTPGRFLMADVTQLPLTGEASDEALSKATWELLKRGYFDKDFQDVKVLWLSTTGNYNYHMGGAKVLTFDDMKGKKIRAGGAGHIQIVKALGSVPVGMAAPEVYGALDKGTIDGAFIPYSFLIAFRTEAVTKSVAEVRVGANTFLFSMNKAKFEKLPADIRAIIDEISPKYVGINGKQHDDFANKAQGLLKKAGAVIVQFSATDMKKVEDAMAPIWQKWIADGEAKGLPRKKMVNDLYSILKGMGVQKPFQGYTP